MLTDKALRNPRRRMPELRRVVFKLRSLKRSRYSHKQCSVEFGPDGGRAILFFLDDAINFLRCTYANHLDDSYSSKKAIENMLYAISVLRQEAVIRIAANKPKGFSQKAIGSFTRAVTKLYHATRYTDINFDCEPTWVRLALVAQVLFATAEPRKIPNGKG